MLDSVIVPTILTEQPADFSKFLQLYPTFAKRIQIDVADGGFVATQTIQPNAITQLPAGVDFDFHLMVIRPSEYVKDIVRLKPNLVIFHAEAGENLLTTMAAIKKAGIKVGVALLQRTFPGIVKQYIAAADHVLIFAGNLGKNGGTADLLQTEKIKLVKAINPNCEIGWDGGINLDNVRAVAHSGVDVINVGSFIAMNPDPKAAYESLIEEGKQRGVKL